MHSHSLLPPHQLSRLPLAAAAGLHSSWISSSFLRVYGTRGRPQSCDPFKHVCVNKVSVAAAARLKERKRNILPPDIRSNSPFSRYQKILFFPSVPSHTGLPQHPRL